MALGMFRISFVAWPRKDAQCPPRRKAVVTLCTHLIVWMTTHAVACQLSKEMLIENLNCELSASPGVVRQHMLHSPFLFLYSKGLGASCCDRLAVLGAQFRPNRQSYGRRKRIVW